MKIALVHDHLAQDGGAEQVLKAFSDIWPDAPIFVVVHDRKVANKFFAGRDVRTSFIQKMPFGLRRYQWFMPLMPTAVESFDLSEFDVVLSSTASFAKGVDYQPWNTPLELLSFSNTLFVDRYPYIRARVERCSKNGKTIRSIFIDVHSPVGSNGS